MTINLWILLIGLGVVVGMIIGARWSDWRARKASKVIEREIEQLKSCIEDTVKDVANSSFDEGYDLCCRMTEIKYSHKGFIINWDKELEQIIKEKLGG